MKLLHLDSSTLGSASTSRRLTAQVVDAVRSAAPTTAVTYRDLDRDAPAHLSGALLMSAAADAATLTPALLADRRQGEAILAEFLASDLLVIGAPMYNFSIPTPLKAWIDRIVQAGVTFRYGASGVEGLATGKRAIIVSSRGGVYADGGALDHQEAYLRGVLGFIGVTDVTIVRAEGLKMGDQAAANAVKSAESSIDHAVAHLLAREALAA